VCKNPFKPCQHELHSHVTTTTGEWDTLICRVPVSAKPIMAKAPISMQKVINRPLGSLILAKKGATAWWNGEPPTTKGESALFLRSPARPQATVSRMAYRSGRVIGTDMLHVLPELLRVSSDGQ
jgi:hypothetical protein